MNIPAVYVDCLSQLSPWWSVLDPSRPATRIPVSATSTLPITTATAMIQSTMKMYSDIF